VTSVPGATRGRTVGGMVRRVVRPGRLAIGALAGGAVALLVAAIAVVGGGWVAVARDWDPDGPTCEFYASEVSARVTGRERIDWGIVPARECVADRPGAGSRPITGRSDAPYVAGVAGFVAGWTPGIAAFVLVGRALGDPSAGPAVRRRRPAQSPRRANR
jgi:hypothetical protein